MSASHHAACFWLGLPANRQPSLPSSKLKPFPPVEWLCCPVQTEVLAPCSCLAALRNWACPALPPPSNHHRCQTPHHSHSVPEHRITKACKNHQSLQKPPKLVKDGYSRSITRHSNLTSRHSRNPVCKVIQPSV